MQCPRVSVVVPAYNAQRTIAHTIQSLLSQSYSGEIKIIVVDDGSTDNTQKIVRSFSEVDFLRQANSGPAAARNRGAFHSQDDFILFTDSDCIPHRNWVEKIISGFLSQDIGAVCGSYGIANPQKILARCIHDEIMFRHKLRMPVYPRSFGSYNVGIRRSVFREAGGFDESYRRASGEDNDLSYKILKSGQRIFFVKDALVDHYHTASIKKYLHEQFRHGFWRAKMCWDHPNMARGDDYTFWKDIVEVPFVFLVCLILFLVFAKWMPSKFIILYMAASFLLFEFYFANVICKTIYAKFYFSFVMFLRAFVRSFGLSTGILVYLVKIVLKKVNKILKAKVAMLS